MEGLPVVKVAVGRYHLLWVAVKARDTVIDHDIAIGLLATRPGTEPDYWQPFRPEAHSIDRLVEQHTFPINGGDIDDQVYLVMPVSDRHSPLNATDQ
jgi:hypothetical protein